MPIIITFKVNLYFIIMRLDFCLSLFTKGSTWAFFSLLVVLEFFLKLGKYLYYFWNIPLFTVKIMIMAFSQLHKLWKNYLPPSLQKSSPSRPPLLSPRAPWALWGRLSPHTSAAHWGRPPTAGLRLDTCGWQATV